MSKNLNLPSPKELAKKEPTRPISLRIKEKTILAFEKLAQQHSVTANYLINNLLDAYVSTLETPDDPKKDRLISRKVMSQYLEKLAAKVAQATNEELIIALANNKDFSNVEDCEIDEYSWQINHPAEADATISTFMGDDLHVEFIPEDIKKAEYSEDGTDEFTIRIVHIPLKKYPIVANMVLGYVVKNENLYENRTQKIDIKSIKKIINVVNANDDRTMLAKKVGRILAEYEGVQDE